MAFFRNNTVNWLNLHYGIHALALSGGGAFYCAFLLRAGVPAPMVLTALAAIIAGRFVVRPLVLAPARRFGLKPMVIAGTIMTSLQYPLLAEVHGVGWNLAALCLVSSLGDTVYWTSYHAYFASLGDARDRGHQIGAREAIAAMVGVIGPLVTGWSLNVLGPHITFWATCLILLTAALPIFMARNVAVPQSAPGALKAALTSLMIFTADGWITSGFWFVWQIALFVSLKQSFVAFGGAEALAALAAAVSGLVLGRLIDRGHGRRAVWLSAGALTLAVGLRAASYGDPVRAVLANAAGALAPALYMPTMMTAVYNQAQRSPCVMRFHMLTEAGWDVGGALGCLTAAGLLWAGAPLGGAVLLALLGVAAVTVLLWRYYAAEPDR